MKDPNGSGRSAAAVPSVARLGASTIRVLCVDDHEFIADGLASRMDSERDLALVGRLPSADGLSDEIARLRAQIVLLDLEMPGPSPLEAMAEALRQHPRVKFIVLSAHLRDGAMSAAVERGAVGYFVKSEPPTDLIRGIRAAVFGRTAFGTAAAGRLEAGRMASLGRGAAGATPLSRVSPREMEVLRLIGKGLARAEIARRLCRSLKTIDAHHTSIMRKLDIHDRAELTRYAIREGLA